MLITSNTSTVSVGAITIWLAYRLGADNNAYLVNWLLCLLGAMLGWGAGLMVSPFSEKEGERFSRVTQAVSAFLSGYLLSKLDRMLETFLTISDNLFKDLVLARVALFLISFLLILIIVFINREYFLNVIEAEKPKE
jgi:hypothetical protein